MYLASKSFLPSTISYVLPSSSNDFSPSTKLNDVEAAEVEYVADTFVPVLANDLTSSSEIATSYLPFEASTAFWLITLRALVNVLAIIFFEKNESTELMLCVPAFFASSAIASSAVAAFSTDTVLSSLLILFSALVA